MRAIDAWVNVRLARPPADWQVRVAQDYFKRPVEDVFRETSMSELLEAMDRLGVERAVLAFEAAAPHPDVLAFAERRPDRFWLRATVDPRRGMQALRELESVARANPVVLAGAIPCVLDLAPSDRAYYPLYAKCIELGLPVAINTGIPGPPLPSRCQDPLHLDEVCLFFPELTVIMANGADPFWSVAIRLMLKNPRLYLMTSAFAPRYLPAELLQFMNTRGQDRVLFATDYPFLTLERCLEEARGLDLREGVLDKFLYSNALRLFAKAP